MKWGRRKTRNVNSGNENSKRQFKKDVKYARKHGLEADYIYNKKTNQLEVTQWYNSKNQKVGREYAQKVLSASLYNKKVSDLKTSKKANRQLDKAKNDFHNKVIKDNPELKLTGKTSTFEIRDEKTGKTTGTVRSFESGLTQKELDKLARKGKLY